MDLVGDERANVCLFVDHSFFILLDIENIFLV